MRTGERNTHESVIGRAAALLSAYDSRHLAIGVSELARRSGLAKTTTARLAAELAEHGFLERTEGMLTAEGSKMTASMYRDILNKAQIEADQIVGDVIARADAAKVAVPRLRMIYTHLKTYEHQRVA